MWKDKLEWVRGETEDEGLRDGETFVFPLVLHPDTSGMAHVVGMVERVIKWLRGLENEGVVEWCRYADVAGEWRERNGDVGGM